MAMARSPEVHSVVVAVVVDDKIVEFAAAILENLNLKIKKFKYLLKDVAKNNHPIYLLKINQDFHPLVKAMCKETEIILKN